MPSQGLSLVGFSSDQQFALGHLRVDCVPNPANQTDPQLLATWAAAQAAIGPSIANAGNAKPWHFKYLTVNHIYRPLAESNGKVLELLRALKAKGGDQKAKLFQFLNKIGARALRIQLGRVLEMAESSPDKQAYERRIIERFGGQKEFEFIIPPPSAMKEAAN